MTAVLVLVLLATPSETLSRAHFVKAQKAFAQHDWKRALDEFTAASEAAPNELPDLYFDIAQCHRNLGHARSAVVAFEKYLTLKPDAADKQRVRALIVQLGGKPQDDPPAPSPQPAPTAEADAAPGESNVSAPPQPPPRPVLVVSPESPSPNTLVATPVERKPTKRRWPVWVGVVGAVTLTAVAVGVGVGVGTSSGGARSPTTPMTPALGSAGTFDTRPH